ncbi:helix-turn-helix domain-containing protein [Halosimplex aquaticum]|uniref:Helix-turn-helix domain-containing protein n=1 Tax=Halosimplex aquaticum TaxID=3026162 RepID=A0ABD5XXW3_9EURY|nr:helix-turn-helix domain-containing protein [Halosimplex aquaticum]
MELTEREVDLYECASCGALKEHEAASCCDGQMEAVDATAVFASPDVETVAREVFDISEMELTVCKRLMRDGEATVQDLASQLNRDPSNINRRLNHLVELGMVEKRSRGLPTGGRVHVYSHAPIEEVQRRFRIGLYGWLTETTELLETFNQEKFEAAIEGGSGPDGRREASIDDGTHAESSPGDESKSASDRERWRSLLVRIVNRSPLR